MTPRWITYRTESGRLHRVRAQLVQTKPGDEGYVSAVVLGVEAPVVYRHWETATAERPDTTWTLVDDKDREYLVRSVREVDPTLGRRMLEVEAVRRQETRVVE